MMPRDFKAALLQADETLLAPGMPRAVRARLDARLFAPVRRTSLVSVLVVAVASVLAGFFLVQWVVPRPVPSVGGFDVQADVVSRVQVTREAAVELAAGAVVNDRARGVRVTSLGRTTVRRESRGIRVLAGQATFEVDHRLPTAGVVRVLVSAGSIEVHGTRFTVTETGAGSGAVELHEGAIDFVDEGGLTHQVRPGETLRWPIAVAPTVEDEEPLTPLGPIREAPRAPRSPTQNIDWRAFDQRVHAEAVITELTQLRRGGAWTEAVRLLERELNRGAPDTRERLSFELGLIYTWQMKDPQAACAHWVQHRRDYPEGRFDAEVDRATATLGCTQ